MELATSGDYYKLVYKSEPLYQDSANEDTYDEDDAQAFFDGLIDEHNKCFWNIIKNAIDNGFKVSSDKINDIESISEEADEWIFNNLEPQKYDYCELHCTTRGQFWNYEGQTCSGEIWDFPRNSKCYYKDADFKLQPVAEYEIEEEQRENYAFIFDRVINDDGKLVALFDYLE